MEDDDLIEGLEDNNLDFMDEEDNGDIDDVYVEKSEFEDEEKPEEEEEEEKKEEKKEFSFDDEEKEDEEEDDIDLEKINKTLGTDFKSVEEFRNLVKKDEKDNTEEKEKQDYSRLNTQVQNYESYLKKSNEELVRTRLTINAKEKGKDLSSQDVIQEIEDKIQGMKDLEELDTAGENIRFQLTKAKEEAQNKANAIKTKWDNQKETAAKENVTNLKNAFASILQKGTFYGVTVSPETAKEVYNYVRSGKFAEDVNKSQADIAELAMIRHFKDVIEKNASGPTRSDGIKDVFGQGPDKNNRSLSRAKSGTSSRDASISDSISGFVK